MGAARAPRIGLALGGGAARGWAHIGVIRALEEAGIRPDLVCGTSIGALVGAVYASGELDWLEQWVTSLTWRTVVRMLDVRLSGGLIGGKKLVQLFGGQFGERTIAELQLPFTAVATELDSGRELWLQDGRVIDAVRASIAIPGLFTPVLRDGVWLVDGGLSNPVPVSVARAMRADFVIAVDLNNDILRGRDFGASFGTGVALDAVDDAADLLQPEQPPARGLRRLVCARPSGDVRVPKPPTRSVPSMLTSMAQGIDIMQVRITRSRLAGEPADMHVAPRLGGMGIFDFHRAAAAIAEGRASVERILPTLHSYLGGERHQWRALR